MAREALNLFISYSHQDAALRRELDEHLALLEREGKIRTWHDRKISAGDDWRGQIDGQLETAEVVLLLVSSSFLASDYCFDVEATRALERHALGEAQILPVIARPCDWATAPFAEIQALPRDGTPVTSWDNRDEAWLDVARGLRAAVASARTKPPSRVQEVQERDRRQPRYADDESRRLTSRLRALFKRRKELKLAGSNTVAIEGEILDLRRLLRKGPQLRPGEFLSDDRYELIEAVGQGGFATVWRAWDDEGHRQVAVKVLHGHYSQDRSKRERFFRGARKMGQLSHRHIVRVIDSEGADDEWYFFVMEYLSGGNFEQAILKSRLNLKQRHAILQQIGTALEFAHSREVSHRDVKPSNILLDENNEAKLSDFDLVRAADTTGLTATRAMMGTVQFAAPEALEFAGVAGPAADVYSLGSTAVFALLGARLPGWFYRNPTRAIAELDCREEVKRVLRRATDFEATRRYSSVAEFSRALASAYHRKDHLLLRHELDEEPSAAETASRVPSAKRIIYSEADRVQNEVARKIAAQIRAGYTLFGFAGRSNSGKTACLKALSYLLKDNAESVKFMEEFGDVPVPPKTGFLNVGFSSVRQKWVFLDAVGGELFQIIQEGGADFTNLNVPKVTAWFHSCRGLFFFLHLDPGDFSKILVDADIHAMRAEQLKSLVNRERGKQMEQKFFGRLLLFLRALKHEDGNFLKVMAQCHERAALEESLRRYAAEAPLLDIPVMFFFSKADAVDPDFEISEGFRLEPRSLQMPATLFAARYLPELFTGLLEHARWFKFDFLQSFEQYETRKSDYTGEPSVAAAWHTPDDQVSLSVGLMSGLEFVLRHQNQQTAWWSRVGIDTRRALLLHRMLNPTLWKGIKINLGYWR